MQHRLFFLQAHQLELCSPGKSSETAPSIAWQPHSSVRKVQLWSERSNVCDDERGGGGGGGGGGVDRISAFVASVPTLSVTLL